MPDHSQGFRPTNTLTKGKSGPVTSSQSIVQHNPNQGKRNHILDLKASAGENVKVYVPENTLDYSQDFEPQLKRQKRVPGLSVDSSNSREEFDPDHHLGPNYTVTHLSKSQGKGQELRSHAPLYSGRVLNFGNQTSSVSTSKVTEFHNLEKIMNSNRNQKSKRKRRRLSTQFQSSCSPDSSIEQISIDDELGDSNYNGPPPHSSYRGTARQPPRKEARDTGERSRHWGDRNTVQTSDEASSRKAAHSALITQATEKRTPHLRGQFRDSSGKYRGSDINNLSPDELQSSTTIGNHAAASRSPVQRPCRPDSPSQKYSDHQARIITGANASVDLPPSNIRHSNFTSGGAPLGTTAHSGEKTLQWNVELDAIVVDGQLLRAEGLGLVLSQTQDTFSVYQIDKNLTLENPSLQIQPKKLLKINWSSNSRKLHLISSKCEHQDYQLYIQLRTLKSVNDLVHQLQAMGRCEVHQISRLFPFLGARILDCVLILLVASAWISPSK